jgi:serine/threonine-protein kinase
VANFDEDQRVPFGGYELLRKLAHGGMAEVFLGVARGGDPGERPLVIKRILPQLSSDSRFLAMFVNEAQLAAQMNHRNIVRVTDFGEHDGRLFMVMEYVDGLDCWRFSRRLYPWGENHELIAVHIIGEVLDALGYVHGLTDVNGAPLHVVHRDLSPSNIYLSTAGEVKLGDFGIARIKSSRYRPIEVIPKGKFGYMAPEQVEGGEVDPRSDVYSAGVVLAELLIGQKLFQGSSQLSVMLDIRDGRLDTLEQNAHRIPADLLRLVHRALAKSPARRYATAAEFGEALRGYSAATAHRVGAKELGEQVRAAMVLQDPRSSSQGPRREPTPITGPITAVEAESHAEPEPTGRFAGLTPTPDSLETPITRENPPLKGEGRYVARLEDGVTVGPTSYAHVIELIYTDRIGPETSISVDGASFARASEYAELARHLPVYTPTDDVDDVDTPDRRGLLEMESATEVLLSLAVRGESGLFICESGTRRKEAYLRGGWPIYVGSNDPDELLGECLVRNGAIERMELEMALALLPKFNGHLGDTLIALGMLSAVELFNQIASQIRTRLDTLLDWHRGTYEFYRGVACRQGVLEVPVDPYAFVRDRLLKAVPALDEDEILRAMAPSVVSPAGSLPELLPMLKLPPAPDRLLRSLEGWREVVQIERDPGVERSDLAGVLYIALETGLWTFDGPAPPWREAASGGREE